MSRASRPPRRAGARMPAAFCLEYTAFRELHLDWYLRYAHVRTGEWTRANRCVEAVFDALSASWATALRSACPAARAWQLLRDQAGERTTCSEGHGWSVHCLLNDAQADTLLLHHRLGLPITRTADLMGLDIHAVRALLRSAERAIEGLPPCVASHLRTTRSMTAHDTVPCAPGSNSYSSKSSTGPH
ncbi:hypothetical protein [Streptomyces sp. WM4235]|uniref:hypothetical protein n=1 Tax=Streptomyces sp. WM4235 TaxID=1415551 RepID=UPI00131BC16E|nr:hypothetical protein [Streptomyces sp. WM4235]